MLENLSIPRYWLTMSSDNASGAENQQERLIKIGT